MAERDWEEIPSMLNGKKRLIHLPRDPEGQLSEVMIEKTLWDHDKQEQILEVREYGKIDSWYVRCAPLGTL